MKQKSKTIQYVSFLPWFQVIKIKMDDSKIEDCKPFWETPEQKSLGCQI